MIFKIAFRNIVKNKWRSLLIGCALFISSFFLLISNAAMNGIEAQVIRGYVNFQSGHVAVMWSDMKEVSPTDASKFLQKLTSYNPDKEAENLRAINRLDQFLVENADKVAASFPSILRLGRYSFGEHNDQFVLFGLTEEHAEFLQGARSISILDGALPDDSHPGICISEFLIQDLSLSLGDRISLRVTTAAKEVREQEFEITGIYANGAGYDNHFAFMNDKVARELTGVGQPLCDIHRVYLKDMRQAENFSKDLNTYLEGDPVLYSEGYREASPFYTNNSKSMRAMFNSFLFFILIVIALGLMATIKMNLYERMKEFGTLRAIGYSRSQNYAIIFVEMFMLAAMSLAVALVLAGILVAVIGQTGIYVGNGAISYGIGGERFWPEMHLNDVLLAITAITLFALFATLNPGLSLCYQEITDLMRKRQKRIFLPGRILKIWLREKA